MKFIRVLLVSCFIGLPLSAVTQKKSTEEKPQFGYFQCRDDAAKWTYGSETTLADTPKTTAQVILVNGQIRAVPYLSYGVTFSQLKGRALEMGVCKKEDADFEKQFSTYSTLEDIFRDEVDTRYTLFLAKHNLNKQFRDEDAEDFKKR
jgi:hypothetical protein